MMNNNFVYIYMYFHCIYDASLYVRFIYLTKKENKI